MRVVRYRDYLRSDARIRGTQVETREIWDVAGHCRMLSEVHSIFWQLRFWQVQEAVLFERRWFRRLVRARQEGARAPRSMNIAALSSGRSARDTV